MAHWVGLYLKVSVASTKAAMIMSHQDVQMFIYNEPCEEQIHKSSVATMCRKLNHHPQHEVRTETHQR